MYGNNSQNNNRENNKYWDRKYNEKKDTGKYDNESKTKYKGSQSLFAPLIALGIVIIILLIALL